MLCLALAAGLGAPINMGDFSLVVFSFSAWILPVSIRSRGSGSPVAVPWLSCVSGVRSEGSWRAGWVQPGGGAQRAGSAFPSSARDRLRFLCWSLLPGTQIEHSLLLAKEELSERCPPPCAAIPGQKRCCAMTDLQVWHPQLVSVIIMLGMTWLLH